MFILYSEKATNFDEITPFFLLLKKISSNFCGLLRKHQLYYQMRLQSQTVAEKILFFCQLWNQQYHLGENKLTSIQFWISQKSQATYIGHQSLNSKTVFSILDAPRLGVLGHFVRAHAQALQMRRSFYVSLNIFKSSINTCTRMYHQRMAKKKRNRKRNPARTKNT